MMKLARTTRRRLLPFATTFLFFSLYCYSDVSNSQQRLEAITTAMESRDFSKALELLEPALQMNPRNPQLWIMQGSSYAAEARNKEALSSFQKALRLSPDSLPALEGAAQIEYDAGHAAAIPLIEHILRLRPADTVSSGMLALLKYQKGDYAGAVVNFENAGTLFDSQPAALHAYAICLVKLKRFDVAASVFQKTVTFNPSDTQERHLLAALQVMAHQPDGALETLAPLLHSANPDPATLELASGAYEAAKDTSQAVTILQQAILLDPKNVNLYLDFAELCYTHGSFQVGIDAMSDGMAMLPKAAPLYFARGVLQVQLAQYEKAEADFEKAYELDPNQSLSAAAQGIAAAQENDFARALIKIKESLVRKPDDPLLLYLQADIIAEQQPEPASPEFQAAVRSAKKAVQLQPGMGTAHGVLCKLYLQAGQYQQSIAECRKALLTDTKNQSAVYYLIQALRRTNDSHEIPDLLRQLASLRRQELVEARDRYRYQLVDPDSQQ